MRPFIKDSPHAGAYAAAWRKARDMARQNPNVKVRGFNYWTEPVGKIYQDFLTALDNRINARAGLNNPRGRKDCTDWYYRAYRDQQAIRRRVLDRVSVYQFETRQCRERFAHLLSSYEDC